MVLSRGLLVLCVAAVALLANDVGAELAPMRGQHETSALVRDLAEEVTINVRIHSDDVKSETQTTTKDATNGHAHHYHHRAREHSHKSHRAEEAKKSASDDKIVRKFPGGKVQIIGTISKVANEAETSKGHTHKSHRTKEGEDTSIDPNETVTEFAGGRVRVTGTTGSTAKSASKAKDADAETDEMVGNEKEVTATANEVTNLVSKLTDADAGSHETFADAYAPIVTICGVMGAVAAIVGVTVITLTRAREEPTDNPELMLDDSAALEDVEANLASGRPEREDAVADKEDQLDDSESDASDEEEGAFANNTTGHVSV